MKIINLPNGKYALRVGSWRGGFRYLDLTAYKNKWADTHPNFKACQGTLEQVREVKALLNPICEEIYATP